VDGTNVGFSILVPWRQMDFALLFPIQSIREINPLNVWILFDSVVMRGGERKK
jgi:hypothetical protein